MAQTTNTALPRADGVLEDWLDLQSCADPRRDADGDLLREINALSVAGAPETELFDAVKRARAHGWTWTPIALVLGTTRRQAVARFSRSVGHPVTGRVPRQRGR